MAQVWEAVSELRVTGNWVVTGIPRLFYAFEVTLAAGQPHELASLALPTAPPGVPPGATPAEVRADAAVVCVFLICTLFRPAISKQWRILARRLKAVHVSQESMRAHR